MIHKILLGAILFCPVMAEAAKPVLLIQGSALVHPVRASDPVAPTIRFNYDARLRSVLVVVKNDYKVPLEIYDSFRGRAVPGYLSVRIETLEGEILSKNALMRDGFVSSNVHESSARFGPLPMSTLGPGEQFSAELPLGRLLRGTENYTAVDIQHAKNYCLTFQLRVVLDAALTKSITKQSQRFCT